MLARRRPLHSARCKVGDWTETDFKSAVQLDKAALHCWVIFAHFYALLAYRKWRSCPRFCTTFLNSCGRGVTACIETIVGCRHGHALYLWLEVSMIIPQ